MFKVENKHGDCRKNVFLHDKEVLKKHSDFIKLNGFVGVDFTNNNDPDLFKVGLNITKAMGKLHSSALPSMFK